MVIAFPVMPHDPRGSICFNVCCSDLDKNPRIGFIGLVENRRYFPAPHITVGEAASRNMWDRKI
jgi:hypothetical protein